MYGICVIDKWRINWVISFNIQHLKTLKLKKGYFNLDCKYPYPKFNSKLEQPLKSQSDWEKGC